MWTMRKVKKDQYQGCQVSARVAWQKRGWQTPDPKDSARSMCLLCPSPNSFSITEGWKAVNQHKATRKHAENLKVSQRNPDFKNKYYFLDQFQFLNKNIKGWPFCSRDLWRIKEDGWAKWEAKCQERSSSCVSNSLYSTDDHNAGCGIIDCQAGMYQNIFEDSAEAKVYDIRFVFSNWFVGVQM